MLRLYTSKSIEIGWIALGIGEFKLLESEDEVGMGETEGSKELSVVVVNRCVESPPDLVLHYIVLVYTAIHVIFLV